MSDKQKQKKFKPVKTALNMVAGVQAIINFEKQQGFRFQKINTQKMLRFVNRFVK